MVITDLLVLETLDVAAEELVCGEEHGVCDSGARSIDCETPIHIRLEELNLRWFD